ncbi:MAG: sugar phosphate isomerase/epimerase family protein [Gemmatimonadota bacterium]
MPDSLPPSGPGPVRGATRREFLAATAATAALAGLGALSGRSPLAARPPAAPHARTLGRADGRALEPRFRISLAQWSLHRALFEDRLDPMAFPVAARRDYGIEAVEYVNTFYREMAPDARWTAKLRLRCEDAGVRSLLIMCDGEGRIGDPDGAARMRTVENHGRWLDAASALGCHAIRVNAASEGTRDEQSRLAADGLRRLAERADPFGLSVLVENHGGLSSDAAWLAATIRSADHPRLGTLPDFGNWSLSETERYDPYRGLAELMPLARAASAKTHDFGPDGEETGLDYGRLLRIVRDAGYRGWIGIEYEGARLSEPEGIRATRALLERKREEIEPETGR